MRKMSVNVWLCLVTLFLGVNLKVQAQSWSFTGSMSQSRVYPAAALLPNGQVLVVGGYHRGLIVAVAELYDPATGTFTTTGSLNTARYGASAILLNTGKVLISGGGTASTELYDPSTGKFTVSGSESCACGAVPTLLPNGMVLFSGGFNDTNYALATAELYNPATGKFSPTGNLNQARDGASSTLLPDGKVLIAGGAYYTGPNYYTLTAHYLASAELYDPATGTFTLTGSLNTARSGQTTTVLNSGDVLLAGGQNSGANGGYVGSAELYNPSTGTFTFTGSLNTARILHTAHLLPSGEVLIVAGNYHGALSTTELYNPSTGTFSYGPSLNTRRQGHASAMFPNGQVLAVGGWQNVSNPYMGYLASAELFH